MTRSRSIRFVGNLSVGLALAAAIQSPAWCNDNDILETRDPLLSGFKEPPQEARPRVWWHWLNGNVSKDGITKDLEWMARIGIGGVQTFDVNFQTPDMVENRLAYMQPQWRDAFRFAASETTRLGLELTIASSPGWSLTGGPWVKPEDGLKKVVWSETKVLENHRSPIRLPMPPSISGPFQDIPLKPEPGADPNHVNPEHYRDFAVLAVPMEKHPTLPTPEYHLQDGSALDASVLTDGAFDDGIRVNRGDDFGASVTITYGKPQTVRSLVAYLPGTADMFGGAGLKMVLESSADSTSWHELAKFEPTLAPSTINFSPVTAQYFRLRMTAIDTLSPIDLLSAPGYSGMNYSVFLRQMPFKIAELRLSADKRLDQFEAKAGFGIATDYYDLKVGGDPDYRGPLPNQVVDLTDKLGADGTLDWTPSAGAWRVLRMGWSLTGKTNHPAPVEATGLEVDKLDGAAVRRYMETYLANYRRAVGPDLMGADGINAVLTDSTEIGSFNWTPQFVQKFRDLRGYDPFPWLPTLTGTVIASQAESDRFLYDYRRTLADLHASEHYGTVAEVAHEAGLKVYGEALEGWRVSLGDDIDMRSHTDIPMAAMWAFPEGLEPRPLLVADIRTAASSAHLRGKQIVAAESMTSSRFPWAMGPAELRRVVDTEFAHGVNRIIVHTSPHQPVDDKRPGLSLRHIGQFFTRHETWADMAAPWIDYLGRTSFLLQQGRFVSDVAYFPGEEAPAPTLFGDGRLPDLPSSHAYDYVNASAILNDLSVHEGSLVSKGGARYKALYLGGTSDWMTLPVLRRLYELAEDGAVIVGKPPHSSPSLADSSREFTRLVRKMWRDGAGLSVGKGRIIVSDNIDETLAGLGVAPQLEMDGQEDGIEFVHRQTDDFTLYFIRNVRNETRSIDMVFRVAGKRPELWNAVTGERTPLSYETVGARTRVPIEVGAEEAVFVVFRESTDEESATFPTRQWDEVAEISPTWDVSLDEGRGEPRRFVMHSLSPLNESSEPGVRYFSGVARYKSQFDVDAAVADSAGLSIDLGKVGDIAEVWVNGKLAGTAWQTPYRVDVSGLIAPGRNSIEVKVANLWVNRLIGDAQPGAEKVSWTSVPMYKADAPLRPSGLIGPVSLLKTP